MPRVLLVEDETMLRKSMARAIGKMAAFSVEDVVTVGEAASAIRLSPPDILVSDIDLPDRSGIELLGVLKENQLDIPVIFVSAYLANFRGLIPMNGSITLLEKPFEVDDLRKRIRNGLEGRDVHTPSESQVPFAAAGYVELACLGRHSVRICVTDTNNFGEIIIRNGELWSAQDWEGQGDEAFLRLIFQEDVSCVLFEDDSLPRNVETDSQSLIRRAQARLNSQRSVLPVDDTDTEPSREPSDRMTRAISAGKDLEEEFTVHWERGVDALLFKDYEKAEQEFAAALDLKPDDAGARANVERLKEIRLSRKD